MSSDSEDFDDILDPSSFTTNVTKENFSVFDVDMDVVPDAIEISKLLLHGKVHKKQLKIHILFLSYWIACNRLEIPIFLEETLKIFDLEFKKLRSIFSIAPVVLTKIPIPQKESPNASQFLSYHLNRFPNLVLTEKNILLCLNHYENNMTFLFPPTDSLNLKCFLAIYLYKNHNVTKKKLREYFKLSKADFENSLDLYQ